MKIVRYFLVFFFAMTVVCVTLNAMEQEESKVIFRFPSSRELIELSTRLIEPFKSESFSCPHRYNSYTISHVLPMDISIFHAIVDCLKIIDAGGDDVQKRLLDFISLMYINHRLKVIKDLVLLHVC